MLPPGVWSLSRAGQRQNCCLHVPAKGKTAAFTCRPGAKVPHNVPARGKISAPRSAKGDTIASRAGQRQNCCLHVPAKGKTAAFTCRPGAKVPHNVPARGKTAAPRSAKGETIASHAGPRQNCRTTFRRKAKLQHHVQAGGQGAA